MISIELLRRYPLFAGQDGKMLEKIARLASEKEIEEGAVLFFEGEKAKMLYLVMEGGVTLTMNVGEVGEYREESLTPLRDGEVIGWSAFVEPHVYSMGATASERTHLIAFDGAALCQLMDDHPEFGYYFMKKLAIVIGQRLVSKCIQLMSLVV
jgi:CRP-like cAMP-binding protein